MEIMYKQGDAKKSKIILAGPLVFASIKKEGLPGLIEQFPREASGKMFITDTGKKVYLYVDESVFALLGCKFAFAIDGYLNWGKKNALGKKNVFILIGGVASDTATHINILVFQDQTVIDIAEKELPATSEIFFSDSIRALIAELNEKYKDAQFFQASPLPDFGINEVAYIGGEPLNGLSYKKLSRTANNTYEYALVSLICIFVSFMTAVTVLDGYIKYQKSQAVYDMAMDEPIIKYVGGMDKNTIKIMGAQKSFIAKQSERWAIVKKADNFLRLLSTVPGIQVLEVKFPIVKLEKKSDAQKSDIAHEVQEKRLKGIMGEIDLKGKAKNKPEETWDVFATISIKKNQQVMLDQAYDVIRQLADVTGVSFRLAQNGRSESGNNRTIKLEGFYAKQID